MNDSSRTSDIFRTPAPPERRRLLRRALLLGAALPSLFGLVLLLPSGTLDWPSAWALITVYALGMLGINLWLIANRPGLARERLMIPRTSERWDLHLLQVVNILLLAIMLPLAGFDRRLGGSPAFPPAVSAAALLIFGAVFVLLILLMAINQFFSSAVRWQNDRGHATVREGPYRIVRHPGYVAMILQFLAIPLILGSPWAVLPALGIATVYVLRTAREDRFLLETLPGYAAYARSVPFRLIPGIW
jgi:protein-S-isoprenylcysteine O-methyltransferase Ste14